MTQGQCQRQGIIRPGYFVNVFDNFRLVRWNSFQPDLVHCYIYSVNRPFILGALQKEYISGIPNFCHPLTLENKFVLEILEPEIYHILERKTTRIITLLTSVLESSHIASGKPLLIKDSARKLLSPQLKYMHYISMDVYYIKLSILNTRGDLPLLIKL